MNTKQTVHEKISRLRNRLQFCHPLDLEKENSSEAGIRNLKSLKESESEGKGTKGAETILFVDDETSLTQIAGEFLEYKGYEVETYESPVLALERFRLNPEWFDLVVTDLTMPEMDGVQLFKKINKIRPDIPVIICTGNSTQLDAQKAKSLGFTEYIAKPVPFSTITEHIRKVLDLQTGQLQA